MGAGKSNKTIVVIGATGHFGGRICRRISDEANSELVVTSRSAGNAASLARELRAASPHAAIRSAALDQFAPGFEADLASLRPDIVVHTAGPYQGQDYRVAKACIGCGSHYVDLADGREFVGKFDTLHREALDRNVLLVSGASTLPGLSSAVVDLLEDRFETLHGIEISIAPAQRTPRGTGTIAAVLSYCGKPFEVLVDGEWVTMHGWQNMKTQRYPDLGRRLSGACDVPDLGLLPDYLGGVRTVTFHAALEAKWEQVGLWCMGWLTRLRLVRDWSRLVPALRRLSRRLTRLGGDTGGMQVRMTGIGRDLSALTVTWSLIARRNHGPEIPCAPALILTRRLARDHIETRGAVPCLGLITMSEFDREMRDFDVDWRIDEESTRRGEP